MSIEFIRQTLTQQIESLKGGYGQLTVVYENGILDKASQSDAYLQVTVRLLEAPQVDISDNPLQRFRGNLELDAWIKEFKGTAAANKILDYYYPKLQRKNFSGIRTYAASFANGEDKEGWESKTVIIPFWYDQTMN